MVQLVQTNLLKLYLELKEKDKIYGFFQNYSRQVALDEKELEEYIKKLQ